MALNMLQHGAYNNESLGWAQLARGPSHSSLNGLAPGRMLGLDEALMGGDVETLGGLLPPSSLLASYDPLRQHSSAALMGAHHAIKMDGAAGAHRSLAQRPYFFGDESMASLGAMQDPRNTFASNPASQHRLPSLAGEVGASSDAAAFGGNGVNKPSSGRLRWTTELHNRFLDALSALGGPDQATPKAILSLMKVPSLSIFHVKSHLQQFRHRRAMIKLPKPVPGPAVRHAHLGAPLQRPSLPRINSDNGLSSGSRSDCMVSNGQDDHDGGSPRAPADTSAGYPSASGSGDGSAGAAPAQRQSSGNILLPGHLGEQGLILAPSCKDGRSRDWPALSSEPSIALKQALATQRELQRRLEEQIEVRKQIESDFEFWSDIVRRFAFSGVCSE